MKKYSKIQVQKFENYIILAIGIMLAVLLRYSLRHVESKDLTRHLEPWYDFIRQNGGFSALKYDFSNYTPLYLYWLVIASSFLSGLSKIFAIKLLAMGFDFVCAFFAYKLVKLKYSVGKIPLIAFLVVLFTPTVFLNSAYWGQCDSIYTAGIVACLFFLCVKQELPAFICFGLAFSFKLQALFLVPFLFILLLKKIVSWKSFFLVPVIYLVTILPAWFAGRPFKELLLIYFNQANYYNELVQNAPTIYQLIPFQDGLYNILLPIGFVLTLTVVFLLSRSVYKSKVKVSRELMIQLALISVLVMPYFLPKMHDRYFFPADIISIVFGFYFPRYFWVPIIVQMASLFSYTDRLWDITPVPLEYLSILLGGTIWFMMRHLAKSLALQKSKAAATQA